MNRDYSALSQDFDSLMDFYAECDGVPTHCGTDRYSNEGFTGVKTYAEASRLALYGWPEGTKIVEDLARRLSVRMVETVIRPTIKYDVTGQMFDMGLVMEGTPECWLDYEHTEGESQLGPVHIVYNVCVSAGVSKETLQARGAAVAALTYVLEAAQRPVKVDVVVGVKPSWFGGNFKPKSYRVTVKHMYDPLQIDAMAYSMVHPAFFRRQGFAMLHLMGTPADQAMPCAATHFPQGDIYLAEGTYGEPQWEDEGATERWIHEQLDKQGVKFELTGGE